MPPPRIIEHPMDSGVPITDIVVFMCVGQGYGLVDVSWLRGRGNHGRPPPDRSTVTTMVTPDDITTITSTLTIPNVTEEEHDTTYRCRYSNSEGETDSSIVRLTIGSKCYCLPR